MGDKDKGVYKKFNVTRTDGTSRKGKKHFECQYFVLDLTHDPFCVPALKAYAKACRRKYPELARDIRLSLKMRGESISCGCREGMCPHVPFDTKYPPLMISNFKRATE